MSQDRDTAEPLMGMLPPSFPPEQRHYAFLATDAPSHEKKIREAWDRWGGSTEYVPTNASEQRTLQCGIVLFIRGACEAPLTVFELMKRGADVFEFHPEESLFRRINKYKFSLYYR